jgi:hypothetical protein
MDMTASRLEPARQSAEDMPAVFTRRRFSDPVSDLNATVHDKARLLAATVEMIDQLGLQIVSLEADHTRNSRVIVLHHAERCAPLGGVEVARDAGYSHWCANRFGVEIRWCILIQEKRG